VPLDLNKTGVRRTNYVLFCDKHMVIAFWEDEESYWYGKSGTGKGKKEKEM